MPSECRLREFLKYDVRVTMGRQQVISLGSGAIVWLTLYFSQSIFQSQTVLAIESIKSPIDAPIQTPIEAPIAPKTVTVRRFEVVGSTVFQPWELANVTQPFEEQGLSIEGLQQAADAVTRYYADHGYLTSRAVLGDQTLEGGVVQIRVVEGSLEKLTIEGIQDVPERYLSRRIALAGLQPFNQ